MTLNIKTTLACVALIVICTNLQSKEFDEPGLYIIINHQKGCSIEKWDTAYVCPRQPPPIMPDDFFVRRMGGAEKITISKKTSKSSVSDSRHISIDEVDKVLETLCQKNEVELFTSITMSGLYGFNVRPELSKKCLPILLNDLKKIGSSCNTKSELFSKMEKYFHSVGVGSNGYIPYTIIDPRSDKSLRQFGKGIKLYSILNETEEAAFKKSFQNYFQE